MIDGVDLGQDLEGFVTQLASSGRYPSVDAVLRESVRMLEARERKLFELDQKLEEGLADVRAGRVMPAEEAFDRLERDMAAKLHLR